MVIPRVRFGKKEDFLSEKKFTFFLKKNVWFLRLILTTITTTTAIVILPLYGWDLFSWFFFLFMYFFSFFFNHQFVVIVTFTQTTRHFFSRWTDKTRFLSFFPSFFVVIVVVVCQPFSRRTWKRSVYTFSNASTFDWRSRCWVRFHFGSCGGSRLIILL